MNDHTAMAIIANDLDSIFRRIEALNSAHPALTDASQAAGRARDLVTEASTELHHAQMRRRHENG